MSIGAMAHAIRAWTQVLGSEHVEQSGAELRRVERATFDIDTPVSAVLRPFDTDDVRMCLEIAAQFDIPIYPVSCGKNYGYGSRVPVQRDCVVMDMARLNRIHEFDEQLGYISVEPGVTFQQVADFLLANGSALMLPVTGGPPDGSLVGNALERGFGVGPLGERISNSCAIDVMLADGTSLRTGFGRFSNARATAVDRFGVGPYLDGLLTQSNLGVVTRMTFWLMPRAVDLRLMTMSVRSDELSKWLSCLQDLMFAGVIRPHCISMLNEFRRASMTQSVNATQPERSLQCGGPWHVSLGLYSASSGIGQATAALVAERVHSIGLQEVWHNDRRTPFDGIPSWQGIHTWYNQTGVGLKTKPQPEQDGCGLLWLGPVFPLRAELVIRGLRMIHATVDEHGFDPHVSMIFNSPRSVILNIGIGYDRSLPGTDQRAQACYDAVLGKLVQMGCYPYRLPIHKLNSLPPSDDGYDGLIRRLKHCLDPHNILAPGRYDFSVSEEQESDS